MKSSRLGRVLATCALAAIAACGGSSGTNTGNPSTGTACDPVAFAMLNTANSNAKVCAATTQCIASSCADTAKECAGPDYASGVYVGTCSSYFSCVEACNCQKACVDKCDPDTLDCASCLSIKLALGCTLTCASAIASCGSK